MAKFNAEFDGNGKVISATVAALSGRRIQISNAATATHPFRSISFSSMRFSEALSKFLEVLENAERKLETPESTPDAPLPQAFEDLCYRAAELFEVYKKLPNSIEFRPNRNFKDIAKHYRSAVDNATDDWCKLCNFIKHNSNVIAPIRYKFLRSGIVVRGFGLLKPKHEAALEVNNLFHQRGERRRSFNIALQQMVYGIFRCDSLAAEVINKLPDQDCENLPIHETSFDIGDSARRIEARHDFAVPTQAAMFDGFNITESGLLLHRKRALFVLEDADVESSFKADGYTRTFPYK